MDSKPAPGIIIETKDGQKHEVLLPQGEHLLEYVRNARRAMEKEAIFDELVEALRNIAITAQQASEYQPEQFPQWAFDIASEALAKARTLDDGARGP